MTNMSPKNQASPQVSESVRELASPSGCKTQYVAKYSVYTICIQVAYRLVKVSWLLEFIFSFTLDFVTDQHMYLAVIRERKRDDRQEKHTSNVGNNDNCCFYFSLGH